ncbi:YdeI/OmpD-associated family protein [Flavisolibacter nicotianae]|uniref:YdeI/OmpD-associated family protein n=1 Tax=Flavisolibacter nicotianae TaxID=2364882 RepID=UPI000EB38550|nr:YdeI/OmpD-associated family protein [Flavisolibacter nicotianae]
MLQFKTIIQKFDKQGEKTGWTYIAISREQATALNPNVKTSFRVKGTLDQYAIEKLALLPMGDGSFIMPLNAATRKGIRKAKGAEVFVRLKIDSDPIQLDADFLECLQDEPLAVKMFESLPKGHRNYFSHWIESAKTTSTKAKRIAMAVDALARGMGFPQMMRARKQQKEDLGF